MLLQHELYIDAPPEVVWAVTVDVEQWPEGTPTVKSAKRLEGGAFGLGSRALLKQPAQPEAVWTVVEFVEGERFAWESRRQGIRFVGSHLVRPDGNGTLSRLQVEANGSAAVLLRPFLFLPMRWSLAQENQGLKRRCESDG